MANLSKQIAEARSAGVPQWQIDYVLKVIEKYPEQAHLFEALAQEFEQIAIKESTRLARETPKDITQSVARVEDNWKSVRPADQIPTTYNINNRSTLVQSVYTRSVFQGSSESLAHFQNGFGFDVISPSPFDDLEIDLYTKKTNNLEVPVVKNNIGIKPMVSNYETSKFTKTQAVNYPIQQKQTSAEPLTPSRLADRNAVKIKQHSTYTYNTKPVEVLLGRFDQAGAAVRVKQHSIYTHRVNSTNPRLGRFDQAGAGLRVKQHSTYTYSSRATNPRLGRVGQAGAAVKIKQHSTYTHAPNATNPRLGRTGQAGAGLNTNYRPPAPTPVITQPIVPPPAPAKPASHKTSGFSNIGNSARLFSFDTETTGVNPAHSRIWQMGYATTDQKGSFSLLDAHLNPHPDFDNLPKEELEEYLRKVNGEFSEKAFKEGNFNTLIDAYLNKDLQHVGDAFENTLQKLQLGDILIMQNMNFENNMLAANIGIDKIPQPFYDELQAKLATTSADKQFDRAGKELFQRAFKVQKYMREADYEFNTKFLPNRTENNFAKYVTQLNNAYDAYDDIIKAVHPNSKVPIIELMDISKIFYGNLAAAGLIEKETAGLGLNVDFLTRALFGRKEVHTAASDAKDTIEVFQSLWKHIGDMRNGIVTDELKELAKRVNEQQPEEINRRFISSLKSTLDDFVNKGFTKTRSGANRYYGGEISVFNNETGLVERSAPISVGVKKDFTSDLETALKDQVAKYAELYQDGIMGFNREKFVDDILANAEDLNGNHSIKSLLDSVGQVELPSDKNLLPKSVATIINKTGLPPDALVEGSNFKNSGKVALGVLGLAGLGAMMLTPAPKQKEENNDPVFYNFYDEQYLGTGFVEFKERNKRYVY